MYTPQSVPPHHMPSVDLRIKVKLLMLFGKDSHRAIVRRHRGPGASLSARLQAMQGSSSGHRVLGLLETLHQGPLLHVFQESQFGLKGSA
ncbi:Uncharacterized protein DAT39_008112 [Clarias magur]|uniref:Uncharacterized protein n=1 Tax=Clarias magur TaxID=1594786 RepID=A0A8J4X4J8_CLAMG|nr:Uncharacterized protein DAT39_008112 [Clarias magur]